MVDIIFVASSVAVVGLSLLVVFTKNPIYSSIFLVGSFLPVAAIFILMHAPFVAAIQVLVYAGAIMVLFTFVIMMIDLGEKEYNISKGKVYRLVSFIIVIGLLLVTLPYILDKALPKIVSEPANVSEEFGSTKSIGTLIFGKPDKKNPDAANKNTLDSLQIISFELSSVLIMVALVGALVLGQSRKRGRKT